MPMIRYRMIEFVMFDADGVLFDSFESNIAYYNAIFEKVGEPPLDQQEEIRSISCAVEEIFISRCLSDAARLEMMRSVASALDGTAFFNMLKPPLDLRPFMLQLRARYRIGLATNRSTTLPALIEHLKLRSVFDAIASALDRVPPKPAPNILQLCMKRAGARPERSVYVGDSEIDRLAAQQAGVHFIAVGQRIDDHHRLTTIAELPAALEHLSANRDDFPQTLRISDYSQNHFNKL